MTHPYSDEAMRDAVERWLTPSSTPYPSTIREITDWHAHRLRSLAARGVTLGLDDQVITRLLESNQWAVASYMASERDRFHTFRRLDVLTARIAEGRRHAVGLLETAYQLMETAHDGVEALASVEWLEARAQWRKAYDRYQRGIPSQVPDLDASAPNRTESDRTESKGADALPADSTAPNGTEQSPGGAS